MSLLTGLYEALTVGGVIPHTRLVTRLADVVEVAPHLELIRTRYYFRGTIFGRSDSPL